MSKLSYSGYKKYLQCPQLYAYHYEDRLRPTQIGSELMFGVAIDKALNALLLKESDPVKVFQSEFEWEKLSSVIWNPKDLQFEVFTEDQLKDLGDKPDDYLNWACLRIKGRVMIEAYVEYMLPLIKEVHSVQKELSSRSGILDAVLTIDGYGLVLADHKTSRMPYPPDAIENDTQLALYAKDQNIKKVGFIVLNKTLKFNKTCLQCGRDGSTTSHKTCSAEIAGKRCHGSFQRRIDTSKIIQLIVQDTPEINQTLITESIEKVEECIGKKMFYKNLSACGNQYGKRCPYFNKCWKNDDTGLETKQETKETKK